MIIGMAGGVGSGKSTVLSVLNQYEKVRICMADELGHQAMEQGTQAYQKIISHFGSSICSEDGSIDRAKLGKIVYADDRQLSMLNEIIHPVVWAEIERQAAKYGEDNLFFVESAILFESGLDKLCKEVWGILTDDSLRFQRLQESRGYSRKRAESIMRNQVSSSFLKRHCDRLIHNDGTKEEMEAEIARIMSRYGYRRGNSGK
ncbi:MAG TPA: dephospho-CoA kinase [Lachnospiraceae bacterium]|nr:dephospho-CoA kinase [Lachnospiraceae bacterium]